MDCAIMHRVDTLRDPFLRRFHNQAYSHRLDVYLYLYLVQVMKVPVDPEAVASVPLVDGVPDLWPLIGRLVRQWVQAATRRASRMVIDEVCHSEEIGEHEEMWCRWTRSR